MDISPTPGDDLSQQTRVEAPWLVTVNSRRFTRRLFAWLVGCELLLVLLDATINYGEWIPVGAIQRLFNLTRESSLGNWLASVQTLGVGTVLWFVFMNSRGRERWKALIWGLLAVFFTYMAVDDGAQIHERVGTAVKRGLPSVTFFPSYTWQVVFGPVFGAMGLLLLGFVRQELKDDTLRAWLLLGLGCYVVAVGLDFLEGLPGGYLVVADALGAGLHAVRHFGKVVEEFLEMLGTTFFLACFLTHLTRIAPHCSIQFK